MLSEREFEFLRGKRYISIPLIQSTLSVSYSEAKRTKNNMTEEGLVSREACGVHYEVNKRSVRRISLSEKLRNEIAQMLTGKEMEMLRKIHSANDSEREEDVASEENRQLIDRLLRLRVVHEFDGNYYLTIDEESYRAINTEKSKDEYKDIDAVYSIAYPILMNAVRSRRPLHHVATLRVFPDECRQYMIAEYNKYTRTNTVPDELMHEDLAALQMKYIFIEAFVCAFNFGSHEMYVNEIKRQQNLIDRSDLVPEHIKEAIGLAADSIENELTYENIREIRHIVLEKKGEDGD